jgi:capsular polysaccharide biosynthesis protein
MTTLYRDDSATAIGVWPALRRRPVIGILIFVIFVAAGVLAGVVRHQQYKASSEVVVGSLSASTTSLPALVTADETLALTYAGVAQTNIFTDQLASAVPSSTLSGTSISAKAVPSSAIVLFTVESTSRANALATANAAGTVLVNLGDASVKAHSAASVLAKYTSTNEQLIKAQNKLARDEGRLAALGTGTLRHLVAHDRASVNTLQLQVNTLGSAYQQAQQANDGVSTAQVAGSAQITGTTRRRNEEIGLGAGLVLGLLLGAAASLWLGTRALRAEVATDAANRRATATDRLRTHEAITDPDGIDHRGVRTLPSHNS